MAHTRLKDISLRDSTFDHPLCQIITPVGMLGYGFDEGSIHNELIDLRAIGVPTAIVLDSGSTDSGPQKLALGSMSCPRLAYYEDLSKLLRLVHNFRVPLIFSSAGGDGTGDHVREMIDVVREIAEKNPTIAIFSDIEEAVVLERLRDDHIKGCGPSVPDLTETDVRESPRIVAQMGHEPFVEIMDSEPDFDVIVGGRAYDPAPYAAYCIHQLKRQNRDISDEEIQMRLGAFLHMGKIMECGGHCAVPKSHGAAATVYADGTFDVRPTAHAAICTPLSVAAHALYENSRPDVLRGPGGMMLLDDSKYEALPDGRSVRVRGTTFQSSRAQGNPYQLKLEAARVVGCRSLFMGSVSDPILIQQLGRVLPLVKQYVREQHKSVSSSWKLDFHVYGKEKLATSDPPAVFIVGEAVAESQRLASSLVSKARVAMIHAPYPSQKATAGNLGYGIGGVMEIETGPCAEFSLYHLMDLNPGEERIFPIGEDDYSSIARLINFTSQLIGAGVSKRPEPPTKYRDKEIKDKTSNGTDKIRASIQPDQGRAANPSRLSDICRVLRSKNAGPYEITIDCIFYTEDDYRLMKASDALSRASVAQAIGISVDEIIWIGFFDPARAFKVTFPRIRAGKRKSAGGFMESDVHGSQEHIGLAQLELPGTEKSFLPLLMTMVKGFNPSLIQKTTLAAITGFILWFLRRQAWSRSRSSIL